MQRHVALTKHLWLHAYTYVSMCVQVSLYIAVKIHIHMHKYKYNGLFIVQHNVAQRHQVWRECYRFLLHMQQNDCCRIVAGWLEH